MYRPEDIKERLRQAPFVPFRIITSAGEAYYVSHPDLVWVGGRDIHVGTASSDNPSIYDRVARVALMHIAALEDLPVKPLSGGDGKK
jgi:hypothetical protein